MSIRRNPGFTQVLTYCIELFKLHLNNVHCRQIVFGCSHDNGYARLLEEVAQHPKINQVTLLEGVPFERELATFKTTFATAKFDNLFRTSKIPYVPYLKSLQARAAAIPQPMPIVQMIPGQLQNGVMQAGMDTNGQVSPTDRTSPNGITHSRHNQGETNSVYQSPYQPTIPRTNSTSTTNSAPPPPTSWATKAVAAPPPGVVSPPTTPQPRSPPTIPRNKLGQRIDTLVKTDPSEVKRVQKIKMCNVHYLRNDCRFGKECTHKHTENPTKGEINCLWSIARGTPCRNGTSCEDPKCIYGHRYVTS